MKSLLFGAVSLAFRAGPALADATVTLTPPPAVVAFHPDVIEKSSFIREWVAAPRP